MTKQDEIRLLEEKLESLVDHLEDEKTFKKFIEVHEKLSYLRIETMSDEEFDNLNEVVKRRGKEPLVREKNYKFCH